MVCMLYMQNEICHRTRCWQVLIRCVFFRPPCHKSYTQQTVILFPTDVDQPIYYLKTLLFFLLIRSFVKTKRRFIPWYKWRDFFVLVEPVRLFPLTLEWLSAAVWCIALCCSRTWGRILYASNFLRKMTCRMFYILFSTWIELSKNWELFWPSKSPCIQKWIKLHMIMDFFSQSDVMLTSQRF